MFSPLTKKQKDQLFNDVLLPVTILFVIAWTLSIFASIAIFGATIATAVILFGAGIILLGIVASILMDVANGLRKFSHNKNSDHFNLEQ